MVVVVAEQVSVIQMSSVGVIFNNFWGLIKSSGAATIFMRGF